MEYRLVYKCIIVLYNVWLKDAARICEYQLTTAIDDLQDRVHTERNLDPHHNLFVLVENSTLDEFGGEIEFRANLEKRISSEMIRSRMKGMQLYTIYFKKVT